MTLISFFDEDPVDNIGDILYLMPKRCIFLGESKLMKKRKRNIIEDFVKSRDLDVELVFRSLPSGDIDATLSLLRDLMVEYPDSIFDVSGGTELLIAAAGIISSVPSSVPAISSFGARSANTMCSPAVSLRRRWSRSSTAARTWTA